MPDIPVPLPAVMILADHLRDARNPPPTGMNTQQLQVMRELLLYDIGSTLGECFPRCETLLGPDGWAALIQRYLAEHRCCTPLYTEIAAEYAAWLSQATGLPHPALAELAHFEWTPVALASLDTIAPMVPASFDPADTPLHLSPLAMLLTYHWSVHTRTLQPPLTPDTSHRLAAYRDADGFVQILLLGPDAAQLFDAIVHAPGQTALHHLRSLPHIATTGMEPPLSLIEDALARGILSSTQGPRHH